MKATNENLNAQLIQAAVNGDLVQARTAIRNGADVNTTGQLDPFENVSVLLFAVRFRHPNLVRFLIRSGAKVNAKTKSITPDEPSRETALHWAVKSNQSSICKMLIEAGADVNQESTRGLPIVYAIENGDYKTVKALLEGGVFLNKPSGQEKRLPIDVAAQYGKANIVKLLHSSGAKLVANKLSMTTPLMRACRYGHPTVVRMLLSFGAKVEAKDVNGWTALMWAAWSGNQECVKMLLREGANVNARNRKGKTAWDLAKQVNNHGAAYRIEKAGGQFSKKEAKLPHVALDCLSWK